jgi:hypothetical protein
MFDWIEPRGFDVRMACELPVQIFGARADRFQRRTEVGRVRAGEVRIGAVLRE